MRKTCLCGLFIMSVNLCFGQFVAKMEVTEPIEGICDMNEVYALIPSIKGQKKAECPESEEVILQRLNTEVEFLKDKPDYKDEGMIGLIINCEGEVVQCKMDNKTQSPELDRQIEAVFAALGEWKPGKLNGRKVDSSRLYSFRIRKGEFRFD